MISLLEMKFHMKRFMKLGKIHGRPKPFRNQRYEKTEKAQLTW